jgi:hydroxyacylglutathione hydrolase
MLAIETYVVTPFQQNARLLTNTSSGARAFVDPGGDVELLLQALGPSELEAILLTHSHIDHCAGVAKILRRLEERGQPRPVLIAGMERELRESISLQGTYFGLSGDEFENCPEPSVYLEPRMRFEVIGIEFESRFTPGHSPGHFSFVTPELEYSLSEPERRVNGRGVLVFAGDALFQGSIGRTDLPGGSLPQLISSIRSELFTLGDDTLVLSGHGPSTTVGRERKTNPFLLPRAEDRL